MLSRMEAQASQVDFVSPEMQLLLWCARTQMDPETAALARDLMARGVDWDHLVALGHHHQVAPLLYLSLNALQSDAIPESTLSTLREFFNTNAFWSLYLVKELLNLLDWLKSEGFEAFPFKGPLVAQTYGTLTARTVGDLDICVPFRDMAAVRRLLLANGFIPSSHFTRSQEIAWIQARLGYEFVSAERQLSLDVHSSITPGNAALRLSDKRLQANMQLVELAGAKVPSLSPEYLLLYLCIHGTKHTWVALKSLCDVAEFVRCHESSLDWDFLLREATQLGGRRILFTGLFLAHELLGMALPETVWEAIQRDADALRIGSILIQDMIYQKNLSEPEMLVIRIHLRERWRDRVAYRLRLLFVPKPSDLQPASLPPGLFFIYFLLRPLRMIWRKTPLVS